MKNKYLIIISAFSLIASSPVLAKISLDDPVLTTPKSTQKTGPAGKISPERLEGLQKLMDKSTKETTASTVSNAADTPKEDTEIVSSQTAQKSIELTKEQEKAMRRKSGHSYFEELTHDLYTSPLGKWLSDVYGASREQMTRWFSDTEADRYGLKRLRDNAIDEYDYEVQNAVPQYNQLTKDISDENIKWVSKIMDSIIKDLGVETPPGFSIFTMGSLARGESGFYTDLEIGFLVDDDAMTPENMKTLLLIANTLNQRLFFLGEHPDYGGYGMRLDEAANAPLYLRFGYEDLTPEEAKKQLISALSSYDFEKIPWGGSRLFISTPSKLAAHSDPEYIAKADSENVYINSQKRKKVIEEEYKKARAKPENADISDEQLKEGIRYLVDLIEKPLGIRDRRESKNIVVLGRNMMNIYGEQKTFDAFLKAREPFLAGAAKDNPDRYVSQRHEIPMESMKENILRIGGDPSSIFLTGKLGDKVDIKRELYRFSEQFVTNLGFYFNLQTQNTIDIVSELMKKGVISQEIGEKLQEYMNFMVGLRLKQQRVLSSQAHAVYLNEDTFQKDLKKLQSEFSTLRGNLAFLEESQSSDQALKSAKKAVTDKTHEIEEVKKVAPGKIITPAEVEMLNTKYLPFALELF
ncbi:MAG TPA: hypothetical protein DD412_08635 [Holosporales bacterium]|nr:hypothetical protein [Holosporales bacterium]